MKKRVCYDPGHGGSQPGAVYGTIQEKEVNLIVTEYAIEGLHAVDPEIWVCSTRIADFTMSLEERCVFANNMKVDCFVSIHCNADPDTDESGMPEAKGEEIWFYDNSRKGIRLAQCLADEVDRIFPDEPFRGIKQTRAIGADPQTDKRPFLYVISYTNAPACLIELGFIDKSSSKETFTDELTLRKIGALVARGTHEYLTLNL